MIFVVDYYKGLRSRTLSKTGFSLLLLVSVISLVFVCDGFRRLNRLLEHDNLGISKRQIVLHIGSFILSSLAMGMFMFVLARGIDVNDESQMER